MASCELFEVSGHLEKFKENMFLIPFKEAKDYVLRPMSCPNHIQIYKKGLKSYAQLPLKLFEFGEVARNEASGALQTLFRMRGFCQDDSHVFSSEQQMERVLSDYIAMAKSLYSKLGFYDIEYQISLRPAQRFGDDDLWDKAENALRQACLNNGISSWKEEQGGGAFYGPKLELHLKDKLGRSWQCGTIQVDYVLPRRFELEFVNKDNQSEVPVILHHAVLGSLERFIGILLENHGEDLPFELKPCQVAVVAIKPEQESYARNVVQQLKKKGLRVKLLCEQDHLNNKIKKAQGLYPRDILVIGAKEEQELGVNLRSKDGQKTLCLQEYLESLN